MARDALPTRRAIAEFWIEFEKEHQQAPPWDTYGWDWAEAACMACGYWASSWDCEKDPMQSWNRAKGLQRCHVVPAALGGSAKPRNFVLMCADCHREAPDISDPGVLFRWMRDRPLQRMPGMAMTLATMREIAEVVEGTAAEVRAKVHEAISAASVHLDAAAGAAYSKGTEEYIVSKVRGNG